MTLEQAQAEFKAATEAYATAKRGAANQRFAAQHGMSNSLAFCEMVEHTAYHNWLRAHEKVVALQPTPTPKPTITPKPALSPVKAAFALQTAVVKSSAATTATKTSASNAGSFDFLGHLNDQCRESENRVYARYGLPPRPRS